MSRVGYKELCNRCLDGIDVSVTSLFILGNYNRPSERPTKPTIQPTKRRRVHGAVTLPMRTCRRRGAAIWRVNKTSSQDLFLLMVSSATAIARLAEPVLALAVVAVAVLALGAPVAVLLTYDVNCKLINIIIMCEVFLKHRPPPSLWKSIPS